MRTMGVTEAVEELATTFQGLGRREEHPSDAFFFFVGAGVSTPQVPLASAIEEQCRALATTRSTPSDAPGPESSAMERYSYWLGRAYPNAIDRQEFLRKLIEQQPISAANLRLAHLLLSKQGPTLVVTPNFDDLLSRALTLFGKGHVMCDHPATAERIDPENTSDIQILHVHGTYWFYDLRNLGAEIAAVAGDTLAHRTIASRLDLILANRSPLVLGYSGWQNDVFMTALERRLEGPPLRYNLYWFCYRKSDVASLSPFLKNRNDVVVVAPDASRPVAAPSPPEVGADERQPGPLGPAVQKEDGTRTAAAVFDALIQKLEIDKPPLTRNPISFYARQLRVSLLPVDQQAESDGEAADTEAKAEDLRGRANESEGDFYGIRSVIARLGSIADQWASQPGKDERGEEATLEAMRDGLRRSLYGDVVEAARALKLEHLNDGELADAAEMAYLAATGLLDDSDVELAAYDLVIQAVDTLVKRGELPPGLAAKAAQALLYKGVTLGGSRAQHPEALAAYEEIVRRFGDNDDPAVREQVALALVNQSNELSILGRLPDSLEACNEVLCRFQADDDPRFRVAVVVALATKARRSTFSGTPNEH